MIAEAIKNEAETIIIVGNDKTFSRAIKTAAREDVTIGYIPLDPKSKYAKILGINSEEEAVDVLSRRVVKKIDIGKINNSIYFLTSIEIDSQDVKIECDKKFTATPEGNINHISICNFGNIIEAKEINNEIICNPNDGFLDIVFYNKNKTKILKKPGKKDTVIPVKKSFVESNGEEVSLMVDGDVVAKTPATIEMGAQKIKLIVGKNRMF